MTSLAASVRTLAEAAGRAILDIYEGPAAQPTYKADKSPLTEADLRAHDILVAGLSSIAPGVPIVSEEGQVGHLGGHSRDAWWLVDPLDGTKEFLKRTGEFTVNVALIENGLPRLGIVHAPALGTTWVGVDGHASLHTGDDERPIRVRAVNPDRLGIVASRDHAGPMVTALLARLVSAETLSMGSSLKFCLVAEGRADLYLRDGPTMEWDTAAADAVLRAAGGVVLTLEGTPLQYGKPDLRNPAFVAVGDPDFAWNDLLELAAESR